ncbi:MAG: hypothetical protein BMS9Abin13_270 [Patescibacteria group bacterium]|nr:MAG: hypothetical protein BMS9Abin13_270 [Patescibacteria group bacterium]
MRLRLQYSFNTLHVIYAMGFLFALSLAIPLYVNSTFLSEYVPEQWVGALYIAGSLLTIFWLAVIPAILRRFGNYKTTAFLMLLGMVLTLGLGFSKSLILIAPIFIVYSALLSIIFFTLDVFLESYSTDDKTGRIRGISLTMINVAILISPAIAGLTLTNGDYWKIYSLATFFMFAVLTLLVIRFRKFKDPHYENIPFGDTLKQMYRNKDVYRIFMASLLLRFFFAWMVIYTPIYLHEYIGFAWNQIGIMFTIMLLPYVLFELPAGRLADTKWGEKEFLSAGFVILAITSASLAFITSASFLLWAGALFATRIGASIVEVMTESYFFKHIGAADTNTLGLYRNARPIAYILAPLGATAFLYVFDFRYLFLALGLVMLMGLRYSLTLKDTK